MERRLSISTVSVSTVILAEGMEFGVHGCAVSWDQGCTSSTSFLDSRHLSLGSGR